MTPDTEQFLSRSMRHLAALRDSGPAPAKTTVPFPEGWFDLPQEVLSDLGAMMFLAALNRFHAPRTLPQALAQFEPPLRLRQYRIFRSGGYPRAFITWAGLTRLAERRLAVDHLPLRPPDWNAGGSKWVIDLVAPFGHVDQLLRMLARNRTETRLRTLWHNRAGTRYRIVEWTRPHPDAAVSVTSYGTGQFAKLLDGRD